MKTTHETSLLKHERGSMCMLGSATVMLLATFTFATTEYVQIQTVKNRVQLAATAALQGSSNDMNNSAIQHEFAALFDANFDEKDRASRIEQAQVTRDGNALVGSVVVNVPLSGVLGEMGLSVNISADASLKPKLKA